MNYKNYFGFSENNYSNKNNNISILMLNKPEIYKLDTQISKLSINNPLINYIQIAKQCLLLEDHLAQANLRCSKCIHKHLLTISALLEESYLLDSQARKYVNINNYLQHSIGNLYSINIKQFGPYILKQIRAGRQLIQRLII